MTTIYEVYPYFRKGRIIAGDLIGCVYFSNRLRVFISTIMNLVLSNVVACQTFPDRE